MSGKTSQWSQLSTTVRNVNIQRFHLRSDLIGGGAHMGRRTYIHFNPLEFLALSLN